MADAFCSLGSFLSGLLMPPPREPDERFWAFLESSATGAVPGVACGILMKRWCALLEHRVSGRSDVAHPWRFNVTWIISGCSRRLLNFQTA